jgi:hypothetical protein
MPTVQFQNLSKLSLGVPSALKAKSPYGELKTMVRALQLFYDKHFYPVWGYKLKLEALHDTETFDPHAWRFVFLDKSDDADALGYHDLTDQGQPISKVFVKDTLDSGEVVSVTACHELCEMAIDPIANLWADNGKDQDYAYEMCDAVEEDTFDVILSAGGVNIRVPMSNFVMPAWFEPFLHPAGTRFDYMGLLNKPFSMTKGGYVIVSEGGKVDEVFGSLGKEQRFKRENRRMHRSEYRKQRA